VRVFDVMHDILARTNSAKLEAGVPRTPPEKSQSR
jgi:hypothetical protein